MRSQPSTSERGQAIVLVAFGLIGLLAFVALAIDGGMVMYDRRSAQTAADAAALAGAYEIARDPWKTSDLSTRVQTAAGTRAHDNHYGTADGKTVTILYPATSTVHYAADDSVVTKCKPTPSPAKLCNYVEVRITSTVPTNFLHFLPFGQVQNTVTAVAHVLPPKPISPFTGQGLVSLAPTGRGVAYMNGNLVANLMGGGLFVNSNDSGAIDGQSGSKYIFTPSVDVVGGFSSKIVPGTSLSNPCWTTSEPVSVIVDSCSHVKTSDTGSALVYPPGYNYPDPPLGICDKEGFNGDGKAYVSGTITKTILTTSGVEQSINFDHWYPGWLSSFPNGKNVYFEPGIYCLANNTGNININNDYLYDDQSSGALFVFTGSKACNLSVNANVTMQLKAYALDSTYKGLLMYVDPNSYACAKTGTCPTGSMSFNGSEVSYINGTIFAPTCEIQMNGTGGNMYQGQLIGYQLSLLGGAEINLNYRQKDNWEPQSKAKEDLSQ